MLQAVEAPLLKMAAVAGAALLIGAFAVPRQHENHAVVQRLALHAPEEANALYLTAWSDGDILVTLHDGKARAMTFQTRAFINDGCEWLATERLVPMTDDRYSYSYDEEILSCEPNAVPTRKTPRTGYVTVESVR